MRHHHIEVAFVDGDVCGLANGAAGMVKVGGGLRQFDEIPEVFQRAEPSTAIKVHHEGGAVGGGKHHRFAADLHRIGRVTGMLGKSGGRGFQHLAQQAGREFDQQAIDLRTGAPPMIQRRGIIAKFDAGFRQDTVSGGLDLQKVFFGQDVIGRDIAQDVGLAHTAALGRALYVARLTPRPKLDVAHDRSPCAKCGTWVQKTTF